MLQKWGFRFGLGSYKIVLEAWSDIKKKDCKHHRKNVRFVSMVPFLNGIFWFKKGITGMSFGV